MYILSYWLIMRMWHQIPTHVLHNLFIQIIIHHISKWFLRFKTIQITRFIPNFLVSSIHNHHRTCRSQIRPTYNFVHILSHFPDTMRFTAWFNRILFILNLILLQKRIQRSKIQNEITLLRIIAVVFVFIVIAVICESFQWTSPPDALWTESINQSEKASSVYHCFAPLSICTNLAVFTIICIYSDNEPANNKCGFSMGLRQTRRESLRNPIHSLVYGICHSYLENPVSNIPCILFADRWDNSLTFMRLLSHCWLSLSQ
eukprot:338392_1